MTGPSIMKRERVESEGAETQDSRLVFSVVHFAIFVRIFLVNIFIQIRKIKKRVVKKFSHILKLH